MSTKTRNRSVPGTRPGCISHLHDTRTAYNDNGCRCPLARKANSDYKNSRQIMRRAARRAASGLPGTQPTPGFFFAVDPVRSCAPGKADPDAFFPKDAATEVLTARSICGNCPVRTACADWAVTTEQQHGVWGGMTSRQLRAAVDKKNGVAE